MPAASRSPAPRSTAYFDPIVAQGYPVVHHSEDYRAAYRPAYRVVDIELLEGVR